MSSQEEKGGGRGARGDLGRKPIERERLVQVDGREVMYCRGVRGGGGGGGTTEGGLGGEDIWGRKVGRGDLRRMEDGVPLQYTFELFRGQG